MKENNEYPASMIPSFGTGGALLSLLHLSDTTLPIGGFSHSAGLETYVQQNIVKDKATATHFITEMLHRNLQYTDAAFVALTYDAVTENNVSRIIELDEECTAAKLPLELRQASKKLGTRLMKIFVSPLNHALINHYNQLIQTQQTNGNYCIVFALIAHVLNITKQDALTGFYYNAAAGYVTNSVKLIPLGQQDGQEILFSLLPVIQQLTKQTMQPNKDLIGLCCTGFDIKSMQHEQLYSRLYMS